ncbi:hypothetical protein QQP08_006892 [Theobroma cacao]|nr:hypothetical protein QQP08_006892 [Theobroma cacao]
MGGECSRKNRVVTKKNLGFIDTVFSWSLDDIFNDNLYKDQVEKIPVSFQSTEHYLGSYVLPLLEETRAAIRSSMESIARAPYAEVTYLNEAKPHGTLSFDVNVDYWRNRFSDRVKEPYKTLPGDIFVIADAKPETESDLQRGGRTWTFALVTNITADEDEDNSSSTSFEVKAQEDIASKDEMQNSLFVIFLRNVTTGRRIWNALHMKGNLKIIKEVLPTGSVVEESCSLCSSQNDGTVNDIFLASLLSPMNESQRKAVLACLNKVQCNHRAHVELIWGPPGTGKTKTVSVLLFSLLRKKYRTLTCAPTNVAITEVASRVLKLVKEAKKTPTVPDDLFCSVGDILLFGSKERLKVGTEIEEIFLDYRVKRLTECLGPLGWWHCFTSMITFLEDCVTQYHIFLENESIKEREHGRENENHEKCCGETDFKKAKHKSFLQYVRERFVSTADPLRRCVSTLHTHVPKIYFLEHNIQELETLFDLLDSFRTVLFREDVVSEEVEELFLLSTDVKLLRQNFAETSLLLCSVRSLCLSVLKPLRDSLQELKLPSARNKDSIIRFCFQTASLLFSTACGSHKLYKLEMKPLNVLVIDEAAQLKECESAIPLQLPGIAHSFLFGDEWQLPATVLSNVVAIQENLGGKYEKIDGFAVKVKTVDGFQGVKKHRYTQVLKAWDLLPLEDIGRLVKRLDGLFKMYTDDFISRCNEKYLEGDLEVPKTWTTSFEIVRYKALSQDERENTSNGSASDGRCYVENSKVSESLLLMKFYSLSSGVVNHLLADQDGRELELPFEVTDQERDIIQFQRSSFILGRSGTGKTTVLTMKLFKKEQLHHLATENLDEVDTNNSNEVCRANRIMGGIGGTEATVLRQLFVTVSPKLCYAVKHHVLQLKRFASGGDYSQESALEDVDDIDGAAQFKDIPDSFVDILPKAYPLVITLQKFLIMLDGTIGNSFFEKFNNAKELSMLNGEVENAPIFLRNFIRTREVNYEKFCSTYWPHFNDKLTKSLDSSRVFTEIMSHIKGGLRSGDSCDGRLNEEDYVKLSEGRVSILSGHERQMIYDIYQDYEKMKRENGDFDMADLVIDLHRRLQNERYEGDIMDFVYIDEVQDLTMRQIALFKHVCKNVSEGFVFCGDTAQTIARGIDFRFEDIRSLFYNEFVLESKCQADDGKKGKGQISKKFQLSQNFRTHDGVLRLAQSVIDLLYRFFPSFVDILSPETSLIYGEAPILLESENEDNAIATIFRNHGNVGGHMVGFGAEQVILVRDDPAKNEISKYVGKQALVLTIVECKGLEFQDVLLYNFFSSSPLKSQWRVVYAYMKEQGLLDASWSFPSFKPEKHNILCSELKQLYVAITRTRQRLWICENVEEFSKPVFNYWKKKCLVQVRKLDDSLAQAMQVASSPEEWKSRGHKLLRQGNYVMATMCFERAHDTYGEKLAKAFGLRADADRLHGLNPEMSSTARRQAAEIFDSIGKAEHAADCFYMLEEYEKAGQIYLEKCGESALSRAAECFLLAGCYKAAAEVYARGNYFSKCLSVCTEGKLFDMGLQYIQYWKQHVNVDDKIVTRNEDIEELKQKFLESCAHHYHEVNDKRTMMNYVRAFDSMSSRRTFLQSLECFDELLYLEEESGNFLEAANIAKLRGELLLGADLLGKGAQFEEAAILILWFVFANSLWLAGSTGWPLKQFTEKEKLLTKAKSFAKKLSNQFYGLVCSEADILLNKPSNLFLMKQYLSASQRHKSTRGEVLTARMILDHHLQLNNSKYEWVDELVFDLASYSEEQISSNQVTTETLVYFWNFWKDKIMQIFEYLDHAEIQDISDYRRYEEFCLNYFGVWRHFNNRHTVYLVLNSDAEWLRKLDYKYVCSNQKQVSMSCHQFVSAARSYWCSELLSVGQQVLTKLEKFYNFPQKNSPSSFYQSRSLTHIYEVASFLLNCKFLNNQRVDKALMKFVQLSTENFFGYIFPLDWRESLRENMISLRGTEISKNLLEEVIFGKIRSKNRLSYGETGMVALIILGSDQLNNELYGKILEGLKWNTEWKNFIGSLKEDRGSTPVSATGPINKFLGGNRSSESTTGSSSAGHIEESGNENQIIFKFHEALQVTYKANWRRISDYISPVCFLYLVERYLVLLSYFKGYFFTTKATFVEWLIYQDGIPSSASSFVAVKQQSLEDILKFVIEMIQQLLYCKQETVAWIRKFHTNVKGNHSLVVLRLVVIMCLLHLNFHKCPNLRKCLNLLFDLLGQQHVTELLPWDFCDALWRWRRHNSLNIDINVLGQAFKKIRNPLTIVSIGGNCPNFACQDVIFVDMKVNPCKEEILRVLFPKAANLCGEVLPPASYDDGKSSKVVPNLSSGCLPDQDLNAQNQNNSDMLSSKVVPSLSSGCLPDQDLNAQNQNDSDMLINHVKFWEIVEAFKALGDIRDQWTIMLNASKMRGYLGKCIFLLTAAAEGCLQKKPAGSEDDEFSREAISMLDEMKQLHTQLEPSELKLEGSISIIGALCEELHSRRSSLEPLLQQLFLQQDENLISDESGGQCDEEEIGSKAEECSEGKKPASEATVTGRSQGKNKSKKNKKNRGRKLK